MTNPNQPPVAEGQVRAELNKDRTPPYKIAGIVLAVVAALVLTLTWAQFRGYFDTKAQLYVVTPRSGLSMDPGSKATYNGVPIGRVKDVQVVGHSGQTPEARLVLNIDPQYLNLLPKNVDVKLLATTAFGNKYVSFTSPSNPAPQRLRGGDTIDVSNCSRSSSTRRSPRPRRRSTGWVTSSASRWSTATRSWRT
jgi:phospholipid/cholesterol/gamma-HCH transport system substrate-binding protein